MTDVLTGIYNAIDPFRPLELGDPAYVDCEVEQGDANGLPDRDEDPQTSPDEEYQALLNGLRRSQGFTLFFVQCFPFSGGKLTERVKADLSERTMEMLQFKQPIY